MQCRSEGWEILQEAQPFHLLQQHPQQRHPLCSHCQLRPIRLGFEQWYSLSLPPPPQTQLIWRISLGTLPQYMYFTPNIDNDCHDTDIPYGGRWLNSFLTPRLPKFPKGKIRLEHYTPQQQPQLLTTTTPQALWPSWLGMKMTIQNKTRLTPTC